MGDEPEAVVSISFVIVRINGDHFQDHLVRSCDSHRIATPSQDNGGLRKAPVISQTTGRYLACFACCPCVGNVFFFQEKKAQFYQHRKCCSAP